eukprot:CAMPEP_0181111456 /NCGR_PEP_ID=MMETSP1071-20121207/19283_1 /TAXON_ID=35127 /ORGANISM="Thalassiosira sp., Strain NH16" /LENGTH=143 /DNA_ID=CAMNT_0023195347 /DNA_START=17 /DNA_END=444 /DNA_ORIENTATION=-
MKLSLLTVLVLPALAAAASSENAVVGNADIPADLIDDAEGAPIILADLDTQTFVASESSLSEYDHEADDGPQWDEAKNRTKNAADKTADGAKKAWDKTEDGSKKAWDNTKEWGKKTFDPNDCSASVPTLIVAVCGALFIQLVL